MRGLVWLALLLGFEALGASPELEKAKKLYSELKYRDADAAIDAAWSMPNNSRDEVLTLLQLRGIVSASLGNAQKAREAFTALVSLDPARKLPDDLSPRVMTTFYEARGRIIDLGRVEAKALAATEKAGQVEQLNVDVVDPVALVAKARFHLRTGASWTEVAVAVERGKAAVPVAAPQVDWWLELLSAQQGVLFELGSATAPLSAGTPLKTPSTASSASVEPLPPPPAAPPEAVVTAQTHRPYLPFAVGAVALGAVAVGAGAVFGLRAGQLNDQLKLSMDSQGRVTNLTQKQAFDLESQQHTSAIAANVLYAVAGVAAAAGVLLWLLGPEERVVALMPAGPGVALAGRF
jgi:tetratricopeptide (TPR) repeat protein